MSFYSRQGTAQSQSGTSRKRPRSGSFSSVATEIFPVVTTKTKRRTLRKTSLAKAIRNEITKMAEKKVWVDYGSNSIIVTASTSFPTYKNLCPVVSQGTTNSTRSGNEIRCVNGSVEGYVNILPYNAILNPLSTPVLVKIWVCYNRAIQTHDLANTNCYNAFFEISGANTGFQGNTLDMILTANKDNWVVLDTRQFEIGASYASATGPVSTTGYYDNSEMTKHFKFDISNYLGHLYFDDNVSYCKNKNLFLIFQAVRADGTDSSGLQMAEFHHSIRVEYTDV